MSSITALIADYGALFVFANVLVEQLGAPIPAVPSLVIAGALAATGKLSLTALLVAALVACLVADVAWYAAGRRYGAHLLRRRCTVSLSPEADIPRTRTRFERWGVNALLVAKFVPGLSIVASPMAGAMRVSWPVFLAYDTIGSALWSSAALSLGLFGKPDVESIATTIEGYGGGPWLAVPVLGVAYIAWRVWRSRRAKRPLIEEAPAACCAH